MPGLSQTLQAASAPPRRKLGRVGYVALYLALAAVAARTLAIESIRPRLPVFLAAELVFLILYTAFLIVPRLPNILLYLYFLAQSALIVWLLSLHPDFDFLILLYLMLAAQVSLVFVGRMLWIWIGFLIIMSSCPLIYFHGVANGLSLSLTTIAAELVIPAYIIVSHENEVAQRKSQTLLGELQETNQRLQEYASQVFDLAALQERNRLARELHDTVSQLIFSISLTTRSAQMLLKSRSSTPSGAA